MTGTTLSTYTALARRQGFSPSEAARRGQAIELFLTTARRQVHVSIQGALASVGETDVWDDIVGGRYRTGDILALVDLLLDADDPGDLEALIARVCIPIGGPTTMRSGVLRMPA